MEKFILNGKVEKTSVQSFCDKHEVTEEVFFNAVFGYALQVYTSSEQAVFTSGIENVLPVVLSAESDRMISQYVKDCGAYLIGAKENAPSFSELKESYGVSEEIRFTYGREFESEAVVLSVSVCPEDDHFKFSAAYDPSSYDEYTVKGLIGLTERIADEFPVKNKLRDIVFLSSEDEKAILELHDTHSPVEERPAYRILQDTAEKMPEKTALIAVDRTLTYGELNSEANAVGHTLKELGVSPETIVGVLADRNSLAYVMREGVLKSGGAFMPIDPEYPEDRIRFILSDSGSKIILTTKDIRSRRNELFESFEAEGIRIVIVDEALCNAADKAASGSRELYDNLNTEVPYEALAYVIYTSGSTGTPKGVMLTNHNLVNFVDGNEKNIEVHSVIDHATVTISIAAFTFDVSVFEEFLPFAHGLTSVLATEEQFMDAAVMRDLILTNKVDFITCTPSYILNMIEIDSFAPAVKALKSIDVGAEAFPGVLYEKLIRINPDIYVVNSYGPTECTVTSTLMEVKNSDDITIGVPLANVNIAAVDKEGRLLPPGAKGELVILGDGVGRGYIGREDLNKKNFIRLIGMPAYRSGDLVRIREDGEIDFHGRLDNQVKLRGLRVELGEVENVLGSYPGIRSSVVIVAHGETDYLAAYYTADSEIDVSSLREHLAKSLTAYMVPQAYLQLPEMPLTANGKVNKKALPEPEMIEEEIVEAENELQKELISIASEVIGGAKLGITTDLFSVGLSSIGCIRLCAAVSEKLGKTLRVAEIFEHKTVRELEELLRDAETEEIYELRKEYPLSNTQMGIFIDTERFKGTTVYNLPYLFRLDPSVDLDRLAASVAEAVRIHPFLLLALRQDSQEGVWVVRRDDYEYSVSRIKCDSLPDEKQLVRPFDLLSGEPLIRTEIYETKDGKFFFMDIHHLAGDGASLDIMFRDIERIYQGEKLPKETYTGYEYALDEKKQRESRLSEAKSWYDGVFADCGGETLPVNDGDKGEGHISFFRMNGKTDGDAVRRYCEENKLTLNAFFVSAFAAALQEYTYGEQAIFTTIYNGRNDPRLTDSVTMLVKTLPVLLAADPEKSVLSYVEECRSLLLSAMANDIYSFAEIRNAYDIKGDVMFVYQGEYEDTTMFGGAEAQYVPLSLSRAISNISVELMLDGDKLLFENTFNPSEYSEYTVRGLVKLMDRIAGEFLKKKTLGEIAAVSEEDEKAILTLNDTAHPVEKRPAYRLLQDSAHRYAEKKAVVAVDRTLTFRELNAEANALGRALRSLGIGPEGIVGVLADRNSYAYVMRQGALKSGGAFMPIDPEYPDERIRFILEDSSAKLIVTTRKILQERKEFLKELEGTGVKTILIEDVLEEAAKTPEVSYADLNVEVPEDALAYVIYTSGSTGKPKGVMLMNHSLVNYVDYNEKNTEVIGHIKNGDVSISISAFTFDASIAEEFISVAHGVTNVLATKEQFMDPVQMRELMRKNNVQTMFGTPSYLMNMIEIESFQPAIRALKGIDIGAEAFPPALYRKLTELNPDIYITNSYGPTECTVASSSKHLVDGNDITIGGPIANVTVATVDRIGRLQPLGALGELLIMGEGVGRGYIGRDDLNKKNFIRMLGLRAYRSGDLVRIREDGEIDYHGRIDNQVKLRGLRVELGEVESVLATYPGIRSVVVLVMHGETDYLAAYFTAESEIDLFSLKEHLSASLTTYMVPQAYLQLDEMPLTANGKINRKALPEPRMLEDESFTEPETEMQIKLVELATELIGGGRIGITTDLFSAGLSSIGSIRLCAAIADSFGKSVSVAEIFERKTIREIEALLLEKQESEAHEIREEYPVSLTQMGIFVECQRYTGTTVYNIPLLYKLDKTVDVQRLCDAVEKAVKAHPFLLMQLKENESSDVVTKRFDDREFHVKRVTCDKVPDKEELVRPFDLLSGELLIRAEVYETPDAVWFFLDIHHIVSDGVSEKILLTDIDRIYNGETVEKEKYTGYDLALDEEQLRNSPRYNEAKLWYDKVFEGCGGETIPVKDAHPTDEKIAYFSETVDLKEDAVREFCEEKKLPLNAFFTTVFGYALQEWTMSEQAIFSTVYNGRNDSRLIDTVAMLVKTLPVMVKCEPNLNICKVIAETGDYLIGAMAHDVYSFSEIRNAYDIKAEILFEFIGAKNVLDEEELFGQTVSSEDLTLSQTKAPIAIDLSFKDGKLFINFEYDPSLYTEYTIKGLSRLVGRLAGEFLVKESFGEIALTTIEDEEAILSLHDTSSPVEERPAYRILQDSAHRFPDKKAVVAIDRTLKYSELNAEANALGHALRSEGIGPEMKVGVMADRNSYAYVMRQGILKSGGAFMPIDPEYPEDRIRYILEDSNAKLIVTTQEIKERRIELFDVLEKEGIRTMLIENVLKDAAARAASGNEDPYADVNADVPRNALAYIIYTSGSTGKPKGVMLENHNLVNFVDGNEKNLEVLSMIDYTDVSISLAAFTFDVSVLEEFIPLAHGLTNVLATMDQFMDAVAMRELILENHVEFLTCTPSYIMNMIEIEEFVPAIKALKSIDVGAEAFPPVLYEKLMAINPDLYVVNTYGPTECAITSTLQVVEDPGDITIGIPIANVKVATVDREGRLQPLGALGELTILGNNVGRGYIGRDDLNKKNFIRLLGLPAYRSGDLVRIREDGEIDFHGRIDNQVKLRGLRVELGEVESVLGSYPGIRAVVVIVVHGGTDYLAAYFTAENTIDIDKLKAYLKSKLTEYMVPQAYLQLESMPMTANGKVNKKALPVIEATEKKRDIIPPENELQKELCEIFAKVLSLEEVGINENFFELGGTSLTAAKVMMAAMVKEFPVFYQDIFDAPDVERLEKLIIKRREEGTEASAENASSAVKAAARKEDSETALTYNTPEFVEEIKPGDIGDVLLVGATGFLGAHVLRELIENSDRKIWCLIRDNGESGAERLKSELFFYFDKNYKELFGTRIIVIPGDITDPDSLAEAGREDFSTVINCAASVKHFADLKFLKKINVEGVRNLAELCLKKKARLIHVSTYSVSGGISADKAKNAVLRENTLNLGQEVETNGYIYSKYLAEELILNMIEKDGLDAKIMRAGNLMSRYTDGEFQINFTTNNFMRTLRAYVELNAFPMSQMDDKEEFSPIDETARAILQLAGTDSKFTIFHVFNSHTVEMGNIIKAMADCGLKLDIVSDEEFERRLQEVLADESRNEFVSPLVNYRLGDDDLWLEVPVENKFTVKALYRLGFYWSITDTRYLENAISMLQSFGFFDKDF